MMAGFIFLQIFIAQAQLFHNAGTVVFQHDVRLLHKLAENLLPLLGLFRFSVMPRLLRFRFIK